MTRSYNRPAEATRPSRQPERGARWLLLETALATALVLYGLAVHGTPSGFLLVPVAIWVLTGRPFEDYGIRLRFVPPPLRRHLQIVLVAAAVTAGFHILIRAGQQPAPALPDGFPGLVLAQFLAVALPEEVFFRGYLQTNLDRALGRPWTLFGAAVGAGWILQATVFALFHLVFASWGRLHVFAFGLLAGWLRARSGSIASAVLYHAAGNVLVALVAASFRP